MNYGKSKVIIQDREIEKGTIKENREKEERERKMREREKEKANSGGTNCFLRDVGRGRRKKRK